jgi:hypothetical protein
LIWSRQDLVSVLLMRILLSIGIVNKAGKARCNHEQRRQDMRCGRAFPKQSLAQFANASDGGDIDVWVSVHQPFLHAIGCRRPAGAVLIERGPPSHDSGRCTASATSSKSISISPATSRWPCVFAWLSASCHAKKPFTPAATSSLISICIFMCVLRV